MFGRKDDYGKQIEKILAEQRDTAKMQAAAGKVIMDLEAAWKKGDTKAFVVFQKVIRREFETNNQYKEKLQDAVLQVMARNARLSVEPLLEMVRDQDGNLAFPKDYLTFLHYPDKILHTFEDLALGGFETNRLAYEFVRIGPKLEREIPHFDRASNICSYALGNIRRMIYKGDDEAFFASLPELNSDEKEYLIRHVCRADELELAVLGELCAAYVADNRQEIGRLEPLATIIGRGLYSQGGTAEMRRLFGRLDDGPGSQLLDMHWRDHIASWQG